MSKEIPSGTGLESLIQRLTDSLGDDLKAERVRKEDAAREIREANAWYRRIRYNTYADRIRVATTSQTVPIEERKTKVRKCGICALLIKDPDGGTLCFTCDTLLRSLENILLDYQWQRNARSYLQKHGRLDTLDAIGRL